MQSSLEFYREQYPKQAEDADKIYRRLERSGWLKMFRRGWAIPEDGFSNDTNRQKWYAEVIIKRSNNIRDKKFYKEMQAELRKKILGWADGKVPFSDVENYQFKMNLKIPMFKFDYDIQSIMTQLKIPQSYEAYVHSSFIYKRKPTSFPLDKDYPKLDFSFDPNTRRKRLFIEVFADTKIKDFEDELFQEKIKVYQKKLYDFGTIKQIGMKDASKAEMIYQMHHIEGKSYKEIGRLTGKKNIGTILKRYRKQIGIGTRKKQK